MPEYAIVQKNLTDLKSKYDAETKRSEDEFNKLSEQDKTVYLLDVEDKDESRIIEYIKRGEETGINKKYLPSCRKPWYSMEKKSVAPIWVCSANRKSIKFVRNISSANTLTTFHSIYVDENYISLTDVIFCYLITPIAQEILRDNRKELGNGLEKFQPNDLNNAKMLNLNILSKADTDLVRLIYRNFINGEGDNGQSINKLNDLFLKYLI